MTTNRLMRSHARMVLERNKASWRSILDVATAARNHGHTNPEANSSAAFSDAMQTYQEVHRNFVTADALRESEARSR